MDDQELTRRLDQLANEYVHVAEENSKMANDRIFEYSRLLMQIAFASIGLIAIRIVDTPRNTLLALRWGIGLLAISIIFGGAQFLIDRKFFLQESKLAIRAADKMRERNHKPGDPSRELSMERAFYDYRDSDKSSHMVCSIIQTVLVVVGAVLVLSELLF